MAGHGALAEHPSACLHHGWSGSGQPLPKPFEQESILILEAPSRKSLYWSPPSLPGVCKSSVKCSMRTKLPNIANPYAKDSSWQGLDPMNKSRRQLQGLRPPDESASRSGFGVGGTAGFRPGHVNWGALARECLEE